MGQAQRAQVFPVGIGQAAGVAQGQGLHESRGRMCHLRGDGITAALAPGRQALRRRALTRSAGVAHRAIAGNTAQQCMAFAVIASRIDPRTRCPHPQRQLPVRASLNRMAPTIGAARRRSTPWIVPGDLQALATQRGQRIGLVDLQHETGIAGATVWKINHSAKDLRVLRGPSGWKLALQDPVSVQCRPRQAEQRSRPGAAAPRHDPACGAGNGQRHAQPQRRQHRQLHAGQRTQHQTGGTTTAKQRWSGSFGDHHPSLPPGQQRAYRALARIGVSGGRYRDGS